MASGFLRLQLLSSLCTSFLRVCIWIYLGLGVALTDVFYSEFQMKDRESRLMLVGFWRSRVRMLGLRQGLGCVSG